MTTEHESKCEWSCPYISEVGHDRWHPRMKRAVAEAHAEERARLQAAVAVLHVPMWVVIDAVGGSICRECGEPVESEPCATMRAFEVFDAEG